MQSPLPPGTEMMPPLQVGPPPGMIAGPWGPPPRHGSTGIVAMFAVVTLLMLAGAVVLHARALIEAPRGGWFGDPAWDGWQRTMRLMGFIGALLIDIGVFLSLLFGTVVATRRDDLPEGVRRALVIGPAALVSVWLIATVLLGGSLFPGP